MFEIFLLVCYIDGSCIEISDQRGPYKEETDCENRLEEMIALVPLVATLPWRIEKAICGADEISI